MSADRFYKLSTNLYMEKAQEEKTLVILKPDVLTRGIVGEILSRFEKVGLKIVALKMLSARDEQLLEHYYKDEAWKLEKGKLMIEKNNLPEDTDPIKVGQGIVDSLVKDMQITPVIALALEGHNSVMTVKRLTGPTDIDDASPGTIRGDYAHHSYEYTDNKGIAIKNLIHASGTKEEAKKELELWFKEDELHKYNTVHDKHVL